MDKFIQIIEENDLRPQDIEKVAYTLNPIVQFKLWRENKLRTEEDYCFHAPYLLACAAHRIRPARWLDQNVREDPSIIEFMKRVKFEPNIDERTFGLGLLKDPDSRPMRVEVLAKGKTFKEDTVYLKGFWKLENYRNTDQQIIQKFADNSSKVLSSEKIVKASKALSNLETFENFRDVIKLISPDQ